MSTALLLARVTGSLVAVVLLALLAARLARRTARDMDGGDLRVCERVGLTRDTAAVVLASGGRRLLVGVTPTRISLLADLGPDRPNRPAGGPDRPNRPEGNPASGTAGGVPSRRVRVPVPRSGEQADVLITQVPLSRKAIRRLDQRHRRLALPPTQRVNGSVLDPRTWPQSLEALRDLTARHR